VPQTDSVPIQVDCSHFLVVVSKSHHSVQVLVEHVQLLQRIAAEAKEPKRNHRHPRRLYQERSSFQACIEPSARDECGHARADAKRLGCQHPARSLVGAGELQEQGCTDRHAHGGDSVERFYGEGFDHTMHFCVPFPLPRSMMLFPGPSGIGQGPTDGHGGKDPHPKLLVLAHVHSMHLYPFLLFLFVQALLLLAFLFVDLHLPFLLATSTPSFHGTWMGLHPT